MFDPNSHPSFGSSNTIGRQSLPFSRTIFGLCHRLLVSMPIAPPKLSGNASENSFHRRGAGDSRTFLVYPMAGRSPIHPTG